MRTNASLEKRIKRFYDFFSTATGPAARETLAASRLSRSHVADAALNGLAASALVARNGSSIVADLDRPRFSDLG
jgi:hypothetical protein